MNTKTEVMCKGCGTTLEEPADFDAGLRIPCPACGSLERKVTILIQDTVTIGVSLGTKVKEPGRKKPVSEEKRGDSFSHRLGRFVKIERVIDRVRDWYREKVWDPQTGEVIRNVEEPLSKITNLSD